MSKFDWKENFIFYVENCAAQAGNNFSGAQTLGLQELILGIAELTVMTQFSLWFLTNL